MEKCAQPVLFRSMCMNVIAHTLCWYLQVLLLATGGSIGSILPIMFAFYFIMANGWLTSVKVGCQASSSTLVSHQKVGCLHVCSSPWKKVFAKLALNCCPLKSPKRPSAISVTAPQAENITTFISWPDTLCCPTGAVQARQLWSHLFSARKHWGAGIDGRGRVSRRPSVGRLHAYVKR